MHTNKQRKNVIDLYHKCIMQVESKLKVYGSLPDFFTGKEWIATLIKNLGLIKSSDEGSNKEDTADEMEKIDDAFILVKHEDVPDDTNDLLSESDESNNTLKSTIKKMIMKSYEDQE